MKNILKTRKDEIVNNVGEEDELKNLKKVKLLKLIKSEIKELSKYFTLGQILGQINNEFNLSISKTVFYNFCKNNIKKDEKIVVSQKVDIKKSESSVQNIDELTNSTLDFLKNLPKK